MSAKQIYIPYVFRSFQGFSVLDIKEWRDKRKRHITPLSQAVSSGDKMMSARRS
jgi:hypothetical protein